ncbi:MAG: hypothetical protein FD174_2533 [Geobacteraceae bacterium]|nr:MAG: hypothetical protein FD174_2533 [Geobacteraceae bacterium]
MGNRDTNINTAPSTCVMLCGHERKINGKKKIECLECRSFWDINSLTQQFVYDESYPLARGHYEDSIGNLKVRTLKKWLQLSHTVVAGKVVCEVGFGGGYCLQFLNYASAKVYGIEIAEANLSHACELGIPHDRLINFSALPDRLPEKIDIWFFLDSFEHLENPDQFLSWACSVSSPGAEFLIVSPEADSLSERMLAGFWPHRVADHKFHWSRKGLIQFLERFNMKCTLVFTPTKYVTPYVVFCHLAHKYKSTFCFNALRLLPSWNVPFNIGEMGLKFTLKE